MDLLLFAFSFMFFIFSMGELCAEKRSEKNNLLAAVFFIGSYYLFHTYLLHSGLIHHYKFIFLTTTPLLAFLGPVSERYFILVMEDKKEPVRRFWFRCLPALLSTVIIFPFYFRDQSADAVLNEFGTVHIENIPVYVKAAVGISLSSLFYFFMSPLIRIIRDISSFSVIQNKRIRIVLFLSIFSAMIIPAMGIFIIFLDRSSAHMTVSLSSGLIGCLLFLAKQRYPNFFAEFRAEIELEKKLRKSKISHLDFETVKQGLDRLFEKEKIYLKENLTLGDLAKELKISSHQLSEYLNTVENIQFYQLINKYRVAEAQNSIRLYPKKTFLEIALDSGFNSKSNFNQVFKQLAGITPSEFKKKLSKSNELDDRT